MKRVMCWVTYTALTTVDHSMVICLPLRCDCLWSLILSHLWVCSLSCRAHTHIQIHTRKDTLMEKVYYTGFLLCYDWFSYWYPCIFDLAWFSSDKISFKINVTYFKIWTNKAQINTLISRYSKTIDYNLEFRFQLVII